VLHTPQITDTILDGITRSSLIALARARELVVREEPVSWPEVKAGIESGQVTEVFAAGTAAVVAPISELRWKDATIALADRHPIADALRQDLRAVQSGGAPDPHGWRSVV
jgi:branched-chain amino acid aminotransferase